MNARTKPARASGFTFVEALMTIAIIGIMAAILVSSFSNAGTDSARILARQQQAAVQSAVIAWLNGESNRVDVIDATAGRGRLRTIAQIQADYNSRVTTLARFNLIADYLDANTANYLLTSTTNSDRISSDALKTSKQYLALPNWTDGSFPQVTLNAQ